jgi:hypothetical protein
MTTEEVFKIEFELLKAEMIKEYDSLGMRASGDFATSLEVVTTPTTAKLIGNSYAEQLESGRKAGKFPPIKAIEKWIVDKGIVNNIKGKISVSSLAFLIARKISRQGWKRENHGGVELVSKVVTDKRMQNIIDKIGNELIQIFTVQMLDELKAIYK